MPAVQSTMRMTLDPREKFVVQLLREDHVSTVVLLHRLPSGFLVTHTADPEIKAVMLDLAAQAELHSDMLELVAGKPEPLLNDEHEIDVDVMRGGRESSQEKLSAEMLHVERLAVVPNNHVSIIDEVPNLLDHRAVAVMEVAGKEDLALPVPLGCPRYYSAVLSDLIQPNVLIPQPPHVGEVGAGLDVESEYLHEISSESYSGRYTTTPLTRPGRTLYDVGMFINFAEQLKSLTDDQLQAEIKEYKEGRNTPGQTGYHYTVLLSTALAEEEDRRSTAAQVND